MKYLAKYHKLVILWFSTVWLIIFHAFFSGVIGIGSPVDKSETRGALHAFNIPLIAVGHKNYGKHYDNILSTAPDVQGQAKVKMNKMNHFLQLPFLVCDQIINHKGLRLITKAIILMNHTIINVWGFVNLIEFMRRSSRFRQICRFF